MREYQIRRFRTENAGEIEALMKRNFLEVNSRDYTEEEIENLIEVNKKENVLYTARHAHMYVVLYENRVIGSGAITCFWDRQDTSVLLTFYVSPDYQGEGIGRHIMETLEEDEYYLRTRRTEVSASITARTFYEKMGYKCVEKEKKKDKNNLYLMVKEH